MPKKKLSWVYWLFLVICFGAGFLITRLGHQPRVKLGEQYIYCNPHAKVNPKKTYRLRLWDTDWPIQQSGGYRTYLDRLIRDFQKEYPNIQVQYSLLDLMEGPNQLAKALKTNSAPDVFCSSFSIPEFNFKRQIPVGFYLKRDEKEVYFSEALKLTEVNGVPCSFPRWLAPTIWIGNQHLLKGIYSGEPSIHTKGYDLADFQNMSPRLPRDKFILVGNIGHNGFFTDLAANASVMNTTTEESGLVKPETGNLFLTQTGIAETLDQLQHLITLRRNPSDFESNAIGHFLKGNSVILAGVRPVVYRFIKTRLAEAPHQNICQPVIIPSPGKRPQKYTLTENGVICIYRNKNSAGDDHIAAAVKLGQFISTYESTRPFQEMMLLPAAVKSAAKWCQELKPAVGDVDYLIQLAKHTTLLNIPGYIKYQNDIYPALHDFCANKASLESVKAKLATLKWQ